MKSVYAIADLNRQREKDYPYNSSSGSSSPPIGSSENHYNHLMKTQLVNINTEGDKSNFPNNSDVKVALDLDNPTARETHSDPPNDSLDKSEKD